VGAVDSDPPLSFKIIPNICFYSFYDNYHRVRRIPIRRMKKMPIGIGITRNLRHPKLKNFEKNITVFAKNT
jgi:hypothetical protein